MMVCTTMSNLIKEKTADSSNRHGQTVTKRKFMRRHKENHRDEKEM